MLPDGGGVAIEIGVDFTTIGCGVASEADATEPGTSAPPEVTSAASAVRANDAASVRIG